MNPDVGIACGKAWHDGNDGQPRKLPGKMEFDDTARAVFRHSKQLVCVVEISKHLGRYFEAEQPSSVKPTRRVMRSTLLRPVGARDPGSSLALEGGRLSWSAAFVTLFSSATWTNSGIMRKQPSDYEADSNNEFIVRRFIYSINGTRLGVPVKRARAKTSIWSTGMKTSAVLKAAAVIALVSASRVLASDRAEDSITARNRRFIAGAFDKWAAGGNTFFEDVLAPDVVWIIKGTSPVAGRYHGRGDFIDKAVKPFASRLSSPVRPHVRDLWADRSDVIVHWDGEAIASDGNAYRNSYVWIFRMKNMRAIEVIAFLDPVPYDDVIERISSTSQLISGAQQ